MSNENKTALTAEEYYLDLYNLTNRDSSSDTEQTITYKELIHFATLFASLQTKDKDKEIEELKTSIEGVFGWREKNHHLTISEKQLKSQLSEVTKERDRIKGGYLKVLTMLNEILTPTKE